MNLPNKQKHRLQMITNEVSQNWYFRRSGIISDTVSVTDNGIFETLG